MSTLQLSQCPDVSAGLPQAFFSFQGFRDSEVNVAKAQRCGLDKAERFWADVSVLFEWNSLYLHQLHTKDCIFMLLLLWEFWWMKSALHQRCSALIPVWGRKLPLSAQVQYWRNAANYKKKKFDSSLAIFMDPVEQTNRAWCSHYTALKDNRYREAAVTVLP